MTRQVTKHPTARTLRYVHYATTATTKPETAPTPGTDQQQYVLPVTNDQPVDVEGMKSPPHPSACDFNFFSVLSDDDGPYASTTEDQDTTRQEEQASATLDIPQQQQQQSLQTPPPATPLQDTGENSKGNTPDISDTSPEPHTPAITTPNPTDLITPPLEKQETTSQDTNKPPPTAQLNKARKPPLQVNIPTWKSTRPTLVTGKPTTTPAPSTQQLFADPSSDDESLVEMQDPSALLKRQHEGTPRTRTIRTPEQQKQRTNSPSDRRKRRTLRNGKLSYLNDLFPVWSPIFLITFINCLCGSN